MTKSSEEHWRVCVAAWGGSVMNPRVGISISSSGFCLLLWIIYIHVAHDLGGLTHQEGPSPLMGPRNVVCGCRGESVPSCESVVSAAPTPHCLQTGICLLDHLKPLIWNIWNIFVTLPKQLISFLFSFKHAHKVEGIETPLHQYTAQAPVNSGGCCNNVAFCL